jgi:ribonuclease P protein component
MLIKGTRLSKKNDFDTIFKKGKSVKSSFLILKFLQNGLKINRFAFMVSKKVSLKAVVRNKIRRRLSESVRDFRKETEAGVDVIFVTLPTIKEKRFIEIKEEVNNLLTKIISKNKI